MQDLIDKLPEQYQDIEYQRKTWKGLRNCEERWNLIKNEINPHDVVLDLGSSLGYFSKKIAQTYPDALVISFESDPIMCQIQVRIFEEEGIYNVVVCNYRLGAEDLIKWSRHVEIFDTILALAVLHHFPADDVDLIWNTLNNMGNLMIGETTADDEVGACGGQSKDISNNLIEGNVYPLGEVKSHLGDYKRSIWKKQNFINRVDLDAFFGVSHPDRHKFDIFGELMGNGTYPRRHLIKGVNVWNLLHFNIVWPKPNWWKIQARKAYESLEWKSDVKPWNLLVTSTGLKAIDYLTKFPEGDQADYKPEDLDKLDEIFTKMKP